MIEEDLTWLPLNFRSVPTGLSLSHQDKCIKTLFNLNLLAETAILPETHGEAVFSFLCACLPRRMLKFSFLHVGTVNNVGFGEILEHVRENPS